MTALVSGAAYYFWKLSELRRKDLIRTFRQRDRARAERNRYRAALDHRQIVVDISDIEREFREDAAEEATA